MKFLVKLFLSISLILLGCCGFLDANTLQMAPSVSPISISEKSQNWIINVRLENQNLTMNYTLPGFDKYRDKILEPETEDDKTETTTLKKITEVSNYFSSYYGNQTRFCAANNALPFHHNKHYFYSSSRYITFRSIRI